MIDQPTIPTLDPTVAAAHCSLVDTWQQIQTAAATPLMIATPTDLPSAITAIAALTQQLSKHHTWLAFLAKHSTGIM